jgi:hypothetical protein
MAHDTHDHQTDGLPEVQRCPGPRQYLRRVPHIGIDVVGHAFRGAGQQGAGMGQHERVVVGVHDP